MALVFIFIDGVGLGADNGHNPFTMNDYSAFSAMAGGQAFTSGAEKYQNGDHFFAPVDACLGVEGLPQSGTGQVTLFTGVNSAQLIGKHFGPYPHSAIRELLAEKSIFQKIGAEKGRCFFMNAFPKRFIDYVNTTNRWSSTTYMTVKAGLKLNSLEEIMNGRAITAELTQDAWRSRLSIDVPVISEKVAADRVISAAKENDVILVEYYLTDKAGHSRDAALAHKILVRLDRFLQHLMDHQAENGYTMLLTSDHGNLEDLSVKTHTRNPVPFFVLGRGASAFANAKTIQEITPLCVDWYRSTLGQG